MTATVPAGFPYCQNSLLDQMSSSSLLASFTVLFIPFVIVNYKFSVFFINKVQLFILIVYMNNFRHEIIFLPLIKIHLSGLKTTDSVLYFCRIDFSEPTIIATTFAT